MSFLRKKSALLAGLIAATSAAHAQQEEGFTIAPSIGYYNSDNHRGVDNSTAFSLGLGYQFGNPWAIELVYLKADSESTGGSDVSIDQLRLDGLYHLTERSHFTPYLAAGVGTTDFSPGSTNALINAGGGLKYAINDSLALRADFRLINDVEDNELDNLTTIGLHFVFGGNLIAESGLKEKFDEVVADKKPEVDEKVAAAKAAAAAAKEEALAKAEAEIAAAKAEAQAKVDEDSDGVYDIKDQCLNTPAGAAVDSDGCALDDDKDGVANHADQCLATRANSAVDALGCSLDTDNDGVLNTLDMCPNSAAGAKVDATGCYVVLTEAKSVSLDVQFGNNSVVVDQQYYGQIAEVAQFLTEYPNSHAVIEGHTDSSGSATYNQSISERRAQAIANVLTDSFGIAVERVSAIGYGEAKPLVDNDTAENRAINRRVTAIISN